MATDRELGLHRDITRRDFLGTARVGLGPASGGRDRQGNDAELRRVLHRHPSTSRTTTDQATPHTAEREPAGVCPLPEYEREHGREMGDRGQAPEWHGA